jgi:hypothetical protein
MNIPHKFKYILLSLFSVSICNAADHAHHDHDHHQPGSQLEMMGECRLRYYKDSPEHDKPIIMYASKSETDSLIMKNIRDYHCGDCKGVRFEITNADETEVNEEMKQLITIQNDVNPHVIVVNQKNYKPMSTYRFHFHADGHETYYKTIEIRQAQAGDDCDINDNDDFLGICMEDCVPHERMAWSQEEKC